MGGSSWAPATGEQWVRDIEQRVTLLERRRRTQGGGGSDVVSVNGQTGVVTLTTDNVPPTTARQYLSASQATLLNAFPENVQDIVGAMVTAGANITATYNDAAGTLTIEVTPDPSFNTVRLTATFLATLTSTGHAFQIGPTNGSNLAAAPATIIARNNGAAATLNLNTTGGAVSLGNASSTINIPGRLNSAHTAWAEAAGQVTLSTATIANGASVSVTVTFPSGRFTQTPIIQVSTSSSRLGSQHDTRSNTSFRFLAANFSGAASAGGAGDPTNTIYGHWFAIQMTSGSAGG